MLSSDSQPVLAHPLNVAFGEGFRMPARGDLSARAEGRRPKASQEGTRGPLGWASGAVRSRRLKRPPSALPRRRRACRGRTENHRWRTAFSTAGEWRMSGSSHIGVRFATDSPVEQAGFELVVPPSFSQLPERGRETISIGAANSPSLLKEGPAVRIRFPPAVSLANFVRVRGE